ncbi:hypothetical protein [Bradyrhizobium sp. USDA 4508]
MDELDARRERQLWSVEDGAKELNLYAAYSTFSFSAATNALLETTNAKPLRITSFDEQADYPLA